MNENPSATIDWYAEISNLFENEEIIKKKYRVKMNLLGMNYLN